MPQDQAERGGVLFIFGIGQRVNQHVANLGSRHKLHVPFGKQPLAHLFGFAERDDMLVAWISSDAVHQLHDVIARPLDPLKEHTAAAHQQPCDPARRIPAPRRSDDVGHRSLINAGRGAAAVDRLVQKRQAADRSGLVALFAMGGVHEGRLRRMPCNSVGAMVGTEHSAGSLTSRASGWRSWIVRAVSKTERIPIRIAMCRAWPRLAPKVRISDGIFPELPDLRRLESPEKTSSSGDRQGAGHR